MYNGSHEDVHTSCKVSLVETMEFATPVESAHKRKTNRPEREREKKYACVEGRVSAKFQICKKSEHSGKRTFYNIEIATNYKSYKIRVYLFTFLLHTL